MIKFKNIYNKYNLIHPGKYISIIITRQSSKITNNQTGNPVRCLGRVV